MKDFRAQAHHLEPLVQIGHQGLHEAAFTAVTQALRDHELIKVRLHEPEDKHTMAQALADATKSALCGLVGHTVILYKPKPRPKPARAATR
jgi:RNA-binding protein